MRTAQDTLTGSIIQLPFFVGGGVGVVPTHQVIQTIVGKGGGGAAAAARGARGHVTPVVVAGSVGLRLAARGRAGGANGIEAAQLMGLAAVAVEILVGAVAVVRALPELAQMRVGIQVL